ncbi:hypothetical protein V502_06025 [Pseudogymnoascus sp. VKM F-4520 (FW-2644)]|nr:hypothetical protein V502_06025 [Pseudogymnoascus sp. VKM F-4520 (FW-2644)]
MFLALVVWESNTYLCGSGGRQGLQPGASETCILPIACARSGMGMGDTWCESGHGGGRVQGAQRCVACWQTEPVRGVGARWEEQLTVRRSSSYNSDDEVIRRRRLGWHGYGARTSPSPQLLYFGNTPRQEMTWVTAESSLPSARARRYIIPRPMEKRRDIEGLGKGRSHRVGSTRRTFGSGRLHRAHPLTRTYPCPTEQSDDGGHAPMLNGAAGLGRGEPGMGVVKALVERRASRGRREGVDLVGWGYKWLGLVVRWWWWFPGGGGGR